MAIGSSVTAVPLASERKHFEYFDLRVARVLLL